MYLWGLAWTADGLYLAVTGLCGYWWVASGNPSVGVLAGGLLGLYLLHCLTKPRIDCPFDRYQYATWLFSDTSRNCLVCRGRGRLIRPGALLWRATWREEHARQYR